MDTWACHTDYLFFCKVARTLFNSKEGNKEFYTTTPKCWRKFPPSNPLDELIQILLPDDFPWVPRICGPCSTIILWVILLFIHSFIKLHSHHCTKIDICQHLNPLALCRITCLLFLVVIMCSRFNPFLIWILNKTLRSGIHLLSFMVR